MVSIVVAISRTLAAIDLVRHVELDEVDDKEGLLEDNVAEDLFKDVGLVEDVVPPPSLNFTFLVTVDLDSDEGLKARPMPHGSPPTPRMPSFRTPC